MMTIQTISRNSTTGVRKRRSRAVDTVTEALRERVLSGVYGTGEWLPAERDLTLDFGVHRRVIRAAIALLEQEGYLMRRVNCRPIVQMPADAGGDGNGSVISVHSPEQTVALLMWKGGGVFEGHGTAQTRITTGMQGIFDNAGGANSLFTEFFDLGEFGDEDENAAREAENLRAILRHRFAGVVFYPYAYKSNQPLIRSIASRMPFVLIDRLVTRVDSDFVGVQNKQALYDATRHLIDLGHERIAFVTNGDPINTVADRQEGYMKAIKDAFGPSRQELILVMPEVDVQAWPLLEAIFRLPVNQRPTAAVCVNDYTTVRLLEKLDKMGIRIPRDVSVVGFDNLIHKLPNSVGLTTVAQPFEEIGAKAAELILQRQERPGKEHTYLELPCRMVIRNSTERPRPQTM